MNARLERAADSTPGLIGAIIVGTALSIDWRNPWTRAIVSAVLGITSALVVVWAWPR